MLIAQHQTQTKTMNDGVSREHDFNKPGFIGSLSREFMDTGGGSEALVDGVPELAT